ncbi:hypothetical protein ACO0LL_20900 [Undibacterium sp. TC4M20W]|uniref:hypothetical protein n=1 Tax=Undibacterium sp. TC4M20W TaxID=3413052 RepID=UPI003BEFEBBD
MKLYFQRAEAWDENDELMAELQPYASAILENPPHSGYWDPRGLFAVHITNVIQNIDDCKSALKVIDLVKGGGSALEILSDKYEIRKARIEPSGVTFFIRCGENDEETYKGWVSLGKYITSISYWRDFLSAHDCRERFVDIPDH